MGKTTTSHWINKNICNIWGKYNYSGKQRTTCLNQWPPYHMYEVYHRDMTHGLTHIGQRISTCDTVLQLHDHNPPCVSVHTFCFADITALVEGRKTNPRASIELHTTILANVKNASHSLYWLAIYSFSLEVSQDNSAGFFCMIVHFSCPSMQNNFSGRTHLNCRCFILFQTLQRC